MKIGAVRGMRDILPEETLAEALDPMRMTEPQA